MPSALPTSTDAPDNRGTLSVIVPMYREALRVGPTIEDMVTTLRARQSASEVILVDDGSPDNTIGVVTPWLTQTPNGSLQCVRLVRHEKNRGKGAAVRTGLAAATGKWRLILDADNSCRVDQVDRLLAAAGTGVGMVAGSRDAPGARIDTRPHRRAAGSIFKFALRMLGLGLLRDTQCGFKLYRADLADLIVNNSHEDGYAFDIEHLLIARVARLHVREVGVRWTHKDGGQVSPVRDGLRMLAAAVRLRREWRGRRTLSSASPRTIPVPAPSAPGPLKPTVVVNTRPVRPAR